MLKLTIGKLNIQLNGVDAEQIPDNTLLFRSDFQSSGYFISGYLPRKRHHGVRKARRFGGTVALYARQS